LKKKSNRFKKMACTANNNSSTIGSPESDARYSNVHVSGQVNACNAVAQRIYGSIQPTIIYLVPDPSNMYLLTPVANTTIYTFTVSPTTNIIFDTIDTYAQVGTKMYWMIKNNSGATITISFPSDSFYYFQCGELQTSFTIGNGKRVVQPWIYDGEQWTATNDIY
jgi:hypothetical protein